MFNSFLKSIKNLTNPGILIIMLFIAAFEYFVDRPALKKQGLIKDAKIASTISILEIIMVIVFFVIGRLYK